MLCNNEAFTLVELMVALAITTVLVMGTVAVADFSTRSYRAQERVADAQQGVRAAVDMMVREIRMAGLQPQGLSQGPIGPPSIASGLLTSTATQLRVTADYNMNHTIDNSGIEEVTYTYNAGAGTLTRTTNPSFGNADTQTLLTNVSACSFTYPTTDTVVVTITVQDRAGGSVAVAGGGVFNRTFTTRIYCWNLGL